MARQHLHRSTIAEKSGNTSRQILVENCQLWVLQPRSRLPGAHDATYRSLVRCDAASLTSLNVQTNVACRHNDNTTSMSTNAQYRVELKQTPEASPGNAPKPSP
jgi:hypothetical protein